MEFKKYVITGMTDTPDRTRVFTLEPVDGRPLGFRPGQFVKVYDENRTMFRPYSVASKPGDKALEFAIKLGVGAFTKYLEGLKKGEGVWIEGPLGNFYHEGEDKSAFVAGGVGITPIISMMRSIAAEKKNGRFVVFYSAKNRGDFTYYDELKAIAKAHPNIKIIFILTRETPEGWEGECCRIDDAMIRKYVELPQIFSWYICGPMKMSISIREALIGMGVSEKRIKFEGWG